MSFRAPDAEGRGSGVAAGLDDAGLADGQQGRLVAQVGLEGVLDAGEDHRGAGELGDGDHPAQARRVDGGGVGGLHVDFGGLAGEQKGGLAAGGGDHPPAEDVLRLDKGVAGGVDLHESRGREGNGDPGPGEGDARGDRELAAADLDSQELEEALRDQQPGARLVGGSPGNVRGDVRLEGVEGGQVENQRPKGAVGGVGDAEGLWARARRKAFGAGPGRSRGGAIRGGGRIARARSGGGPARGAKAIEKAHG